MSPFSAKFLDLWIFSLWTFHSKTELSVHGIEQRTWGSHSAHHQKILILAIYQHSTRFFQSCHITNSNCIVTSSSKFCLSVSIIGSVLPFLDVQLCWHHTKSCYKLPWVDWWALHNGADHSSSLGGDQHYFIFHFWFYVPVGFIHWKNGFKKALLILTQDMRF